LNSLPMHHCDCQPTPSKTFSLLAELHGLGIVALADLARQVGSERLVRLALHQCPRFSDSPCSRSFGPHGKTK